MKKIQSPDGVALLMENLWLRHKAGMMQRPCNVFMVELPPPTDEELASARRSEKVLQEPILSNVADLSDKSVAYLIGNISFDDVALHYFNSEWEQRNLVVFKDTFDFLRDVSPNPDCKEKITYNDNVIQIGMVESWSEFVAQDIEVSNNIRVSPAEFAGALLRYLTCEGHRSIYDFPIKENYSEKGREPFKAYVSSQRGLLNLISGLFQSKKYRKRNATLKRNALLSAIGLDTNILKSLPKEIRCLIESATSHIEIKKIRSHIGASIAVDYIGHILRTYDKECYTDFSTTIVLCGSSNPRNMVITPFLHEHFSTEEVYEIPSQYSGIELIVIQVSNGI